MRLGDVSLEYSLSSHLLKGRSGLRVTKKSLGEEDDEGLSELSLVLSPQDVEVVGGGAEGQLLP